MAELKVEVVVVDGIIPHPNADRLEMAVVKGWNCVVQKGSFVVGQAAIYIPVDAILPEELENTLFPPNSKVKLHNHRVKTIKLRGAVSQGLLIHLLEAFSIEEAAKFSVGTDLAAQLGITKYEPPESQSLQRGLRISKKKANPNFREYTDIENYKNYPTLFSFEDPVWVLEKIHGSNFRAGYVVTYANTWWKKLKKFLGILPSYEFVYGSHHVQLQDRWIDDTWYRTEFGIKNIYAEMVDKYNLREVLRFGEVIYGEVYGSGVQKGYLYDCAPGERKLIVFDWSIDGQYIYQGEVTRKCELAKLPTVPSKLMLFDPLLVEDLVFAPSILDPEHGLREGVVIKPLVEEQSVIGRKILKWKNAEFLLAAEDDTH